MEKLIKEDEKQPFEKKLKAGGRRITLKFDGICADCGAELPKGTTARWYGRGRIYGWGCHSEQPQTEGAGVQRAATAPRAMPNRGEKLRGLAEGLMDKIEACFGDRLENTPKRMCQGAMARLSGTHLKRTQQALYALAALHESGSVPVLLQNFVNKTQVHESMRAELDRENCGYYDAPRDTGKPAANTPEVLALWALIDEQTEEEKKQEELHRKINGLKFSNIPGYFPTPQPVIELMIEQADIYSSHTILEPSAGSGAIMDAVKPLCHSIQGVEIQHSLSDILTSKGHTVHFGDFLNWMPLTTKYDRIIMNPPFEKGQDMKHVQHAYNNCLSGFGRLVAIMCAGPFFRQDKKSVAFREWLNELGAEVEDLPLDSFKQGGTGVNTKIVVIDKD